MALDSRARSQFQASYIDRIENNTLSPNIKGTAVWRTDPSRQTEGYYVFSPKLNEYRAVHYIEEDRLWAFIACNEQNKWYTIKPVPKSLGLGPTLTPIQAIDVDPPEDTSTTKPLTPTTTTAPVITQPTMSQAGTSTTTLPPTTTTTTTIPTGGGGGGGGGGSGGGGGGIPTPPPGGGGGGGGRGGGGGGGAAGGPPPHTNGRLEGNPPFEFTGDRERSKAFMLAFQIYRGMNPNADVMTNPYQRTMTFLSYIWGPLIDDWVQEQAQWLVDQIQGGVLQTEENLWRTIDTRFRQAYTDTAESTKAQHELKSLHMTKDNLDDFISRFQNLANKAGYDLDQ